MGEKSTKPPVAFKRILGEDYDDGQIVQTIQGTISKLFPAKRGTSSNGEWEFQNGKMKDSEGTEIDISFAKNTQPMTSVGKKVTICSVKTEQHGWNGIKVEDQSFTPQGKDEAITKRVLKITSTADITYEGGGGSSQPEKSATGQPTGHSAGGAPGKWQGGCAPYMPWDIHPALALMDISQLHLECSATVDTIYPKGEKKGEGITDEMRQGFISTIFIEACKQGIQVDFAERKKKPIPPKIPPVPKDPENWKECIIPRGELIGKSLNDITEEQLTALYDPVKDKDTAWANCVKRAFDARGFLQKRQEAEEKQREAEGKQKADDKALDAPEEDDIPF